jgi:uncharacterized membrane protein YphA (DoxX/SURF4 family)
MNRPRFLRWIVATLVSGAAALLWIPTVAAHERWFTEEGPYSPPDWGDLFSLPVLLALISGALAVALLAGMQRRIGDPLWPRPPFFQRMEPSAPAILGVQAAITMIFMASRLDLFVPNIELPENAFGVLIAGIAIVAAFSFITGVLTRWGALATIGLFFLAFGFAPWYEVAEQVLFIGIAIYLVAVGRGVSRYENGEEEDRSELTDRLVPYALPALRIAAGLSILILAFTEKLVNVDLGVEFLRTHPRFNVARELGVDWFTDRRFVYLAGIVEATAGIALLSGYLTRVVILALWIPFNLGIAFLPPEELIGHLPILSTMYVLLVRGTEGIPPRHMFDVARARRQRPASAPSRLVGSGVRDG